GVILGHQARQRDVQSGRDAVQNNHCRRLLAALHRRQHADADIGSAGQLSQLQTPVDAQRLNSIAQRREIHISYSRKKFRYRESLSFVSSAAVTVRPTSPDDLGVISDIYAHHVRTGVATFDLTAPGRAEWARRFGTVGSLGLPFLTACLDGEIVGYAYCAP